MPVWPHAEILDQEPILSTSMGLLERHMDGFTLWEVGAENDRSAEGYQTVGRSKSFWDLHGCELQMAVLRLLLVWLKARHSPPF